MQKFTGSNAVFVGNIPFDCTEANMIEIFKEVGPVANFRINRDRDTGRPKGYGFCEFLDAATAASAVRNLDGYDIGGRQLKVAPADMDSTPPPRQSNQPGAIPHSSHVPEIQNIPGGNKQEARQISNSFNLNPSSTTDAINATLSSMSPPQIFELLTQVNLMLQHEPNNAKLFLSQNPQLCYALFQAIRLMNLIDENNGPNTFGSPGHHDIRPAVRNQHQSFNRMPPGNQQNFSHLQQRQQASPFTPHHQQQFRPPAQNDGIKGDQQEALIRQVMNMSNIEIDQLPPDQRQNVLRLRSQIMGGHPNNPS